MTAAELIELLKCCNPSTPVMGAAYDFVGEASVQLRIVRLASWLTDEDPPEPFVALVVSGSDETHEDQGPA
jgi:hypothetical protein